MIRIDSVSVRYGSTTALDAVSEQVPAGEWVALIGPNGAGKTTLLGAVAHLVGVEGVIEVGGARVDTMSRRRLAQLVAYVPQQPELPGEVTVGDYVLLGRTPHLGYFGFEGGVDRAVCASLLKRLDLFDMATRRLSTLSGGELQRLVLARALAQEAPVLLLDEPTSALDLGRRVDALELVDQLRAERGLTVLSALHDLTLAGQFADRLVLLSDGRVVASGTPSEVLQEEALARHFGTNVRVLTTPDDELVVVPLRGADRR